MEINTRQITAEQFAEDWLLVAMNDDETYQLLMKDKEEHVATISQMLQNEWEELVQQVVELVEDKISDISSLFISQILGNQGSLPFDIIAKHIKENN